MKIVKTASGKQTIKMSKKEWSDIGKKAGWMKMAQFDREKPKFPSHLDKNFSTHIDKYMEILKFEGQGAFNNAMDKVVDPPSGRVYDISPQQYEQRLVEHFGDFSTLPEELKKAVEFSIGEQEYRQREQGWRQRMDSRMDSDSTASAKSKVITSAGNRCDSCEVVMVNGVRTHEKGCPNAWKDYKKECKWCGSEFKPKEKNQNCCSKSCEKSYNS